MGAPNNQNRLSLSSSVFAGRVKKFDTYEHSQQSERAAQRAEMSVRPAHESNTTQQTTPNHRPLTPATHHNQARPPEAKNSHHKPVFNKTPLQPTQRAPKRTAGSVHQLAMQAVGSAPATNKSILADQFEGSSTSSPPTSRQKRSKLQKVMYSVAVVVFLFASTVSIQTMLTNQQTQNVLADKAEQTQTFDEQGVAQGTGRNPAEEPVPDSAIINYQVPSPELPRYLHIPDIDVFARIKHTGIDTDGSVDAPTNIHDVSWYTESAKPGNAIGASLLLGHVQGWSGPGVFKNVDKLEPGARFTVEKGTGETIEYEVTRSEEIPLESVNMARILSAEDPGEHDLKLMTCSGEYDAANESYLSRFVVYAKIIR